MRLTFQWKITFFALFLFFVTTVTNAAVFSIVPKASTSLPTQVTAGGSVKALYTIKNTTGSFHTGNYIKYLPLNVNPVYVDGTYPDLCGSTFSLDSNASCTLELNVTGAVNANDPNPQHHLFACLGGCKTCCAGTNFPLNVTVSSEKTTITATLSSTTSGTPQISTTTSNTTFYIVYTQSGDGSNTLSATLPSSMTFSGSNTCSVSQSAPTCSLAVNSGTTLGQFTISPTITSGSASAPSPLSISITARMPRFAYVTQDDDSANPSVIVCQIDSNGYLVGSSCVSAGGGLSHINAQGIQISNDGSTAYITPGDGSSDVYQCPIDSTTGQFVGSCTQTVITVSSGPSYAATYGLLALNSSNNLAFFGDYQRVISCSVSGNAIQPNCEDTGPGATYISGYPVGITLNVNNSVAYIGGYNSSSAVTTCAVSGNSFGSCGAKTGDGGLIAFGNPTGVALNNAGTIVYIADYNNSQVYGCDTTTATTANTFDHCFTASSISDSVWGITLNETSSMAYVTDFGDTVYACSISQTDGTFPSCTATTGFTFGGSIDVALLY